MANVNYSAILAILNQAGIQKKEPALYKTLKGLIDNGTLTVVGFNDDIANIKQDMSNTFIFGTASERSTYKPPSTIGNLVFFYEVDTGILWLFISSQNDWFPVGAPVDATYLTWTDESSRLPNSRNLVAGDNIFFDDSVPNVRTISSTGGFLPMMTGDYPPQEMGVGQFIMMIPVTSAR